MYNNLENYFQTQGEIELPGIGEKVALPRRVWFRYEGEVKSLVENLARTEMVILGQVELNRGMLQRVLDWPMEAVQRKVWCDMIRWMRPDFDQITAYCHPHKVAEGGTCAYVIAKRSGLDLSKSIFADGHESGEFLTGIGRQLLMQEFLNNDNIDLDVFRYQGEEFADIGGLLALRKALQNGVQGIVLPTFKTRPALKAEQVEAFGL